MCVRFEFRQLFLQYKNVCQSDFTLFPVANRDWTRYRRQYIVLYDTNYANDRYPASRICSNIESFSLLSPNTAAACYHIDKDYYSDKHE